MKNRNAYTLVGLIALLLVVIIVIQIMSSKKIAYYQDSLENKTELITNLNHEILSKKKYTLGEITSSELGQIFQEDSFSFLPLVQKVLHTNYVHPSVPEGLELKNTKVDHFIANYYVVENFEHHLKNINKFDDYKVLQKTEKRMDHSDQMTHYLTEYTKGDNSILLLEPFSDKNCYTCNAIVQKAQLREDLDFINSELHLNISMPINIGDSNRSLVTILDLEHTDLEDNMLIKVYDPIRVYRDIHIFVKDGLVSEIYWNNDSVRSSL